jgi:hypothetical protein
MAHRQERLPRGDVLVTLRPARVLKLWVGLSLLLAFLSTAEFFVRRYLQASFNTSDMLFYLDTEGNLPTWVSGYGLAIAGVLAGLIARARRADGTPTIYWVLAAIGFTFMSADELCQYHESLTEPLWGWLQSVHFMLGGYLRNAWVLPFLIVIPVVVVSFIPFLRRLGAVHRRRLILAAVVYLWGAVGMDMVSGHEYYEAGGFSMRLLTEVTIEETCELLGMGLFIYAFLGYLAEGERSVRFSGARPPRIRPGVADRP